MPLNLRPWGRVPAGWLLVLSSISFAANGFAQAPGAGTKVDSAAAGREHYRQSVQSARAGDLRAALAAAERAVRAWPAQPAYHSRLASVAAQLGDPVAAARALERLTQLGARYPVEEDPAFEAVRSSSPIRRAVDQMSAATRPLVRSTVAAVIGPTDWFAEGIAVGPDGTMYVGSIRRRQVLVRSRDGREAELVPRTERLWAVSGLALAPDGNSLWITSNAIPQMEGYDSTMAGAAEVVQVGLPDGQVLARIVVGAERGGAMLGDLVLAPDGTVYLSDSRGQGIWRVRPGARSAELMAHHPLLRSPQGMALSAGGGALLVADYSHGLLRVDLATGQVVALPAPAGVTLLGIDGLARHGLDLVAIQNGGVVPRVVRIRLDGAEAAVRSVEVLDRNTPVADEPTLGVVVGDDFLYVANSQWEKRDEDGTPLPGAVLLPTVILRLPLGSLDPR